MPGQREGLGRVPHALLNNLQVHTGRGQQHTVGVPQVVKPIPGNLGLFHEAPHRPLCQVVTVESLAVRLAEY